MNNQNMNSRRGMPCNNNMSCGPNRGMPRQNAYMQGMRNNASCNDGNRQECAPECGQERRMERTPECRQERRTDSSECCMETMPERDRRPVPDKKVLMKEIYQLGFALVEIVLYLDTHPCDAAALSYYNQIKKRHHKVMEMYEREYGPLLNSNVMNENYWSWVSTPMPWEVEEC